MHYKESEVDKARYERERKAYQSTLMQREVNEAADAERQAIIAQVTHTSHCCSVCVTPSPTYPLAHSMYTQ